MKYRSLLVLVLLVALTAGARQAEFQFVTTTNMMIAMRDGVKLATDIYLPARAATVAPGRFPVILTRTPYGKNGSKKDGQYFAARGYVFN